MNLLSVVCYLFLIGNVAAVTVDLQEVCGTNTLHCTISDCNDELLVINNTETQYPYTELIFRSCYVPTIPSIMFSLVPNLERLVLYKCSIRAIQQNNFFKASNLRSLYLPSNRLTELPEKIFISLSMLEEIRLTNNHISHMHQKAFAGLSKLRVLELNNNKIHEITSGLFDNLSDLEYIDLSYNDIEAMDSRIFNANLNLKTIILNNNNFAVFESNSLAHLPHFNVLDISNNIIDSIRLQSVDTLRAQSSQLRSCVINGSVIRVRASNNQLQTINIADKTSVKEIDVHSNQFDSMSSFNGMINLQKLDVSKNAIQRLNSTNTSLLLDLPSLQTLCIAHGQFQSLTIENFMLLGKLSHLDLAYNSLQQLDANVFEPLSNLEKIYFEGNRLHSFDYETFMRNHINIKEMGIYGNNWSQIFLKKMVEEIKASEIKLINRYNPNEVTEMISLQTTSHPHHTVHVQTKDHPTAVNNRDVLIIVTLCLVLIILLLQLFRILKDENLLNFCNPTIRWTNRPRRLDEEESEQL